MIPSSNLMKARAERHKRIKRLYLRSLVEDITDEEKETLKTMSWLVDEIKKEVLSQIGYK
jgi:hypothetical protein